MVDGSLYIRLPEINRSNRITNDSPTSDKSKTSLYAQKLAEESAPIAGTIVEKYLRDIRGIENTNTAGVRYHPRVFTGKDEEQKYMPAMLALCRDRNGDIQSVQATYLDSQTADKADLDISKRTYASPSGGLVFLNEEQSNKSNISFIAEGIETGLSIRDAMKELKNKDIAVTLGKSNFANIDPQAVGQKVIFCLDNDGDKALTDNIINKSAERLISFGKDVLIAVPEKTSNYSEQAKIDFNDVAKTEGIDAIRRTIDNSVSYGEWKKSIENSKHQSNQINQDSLQISQKKIKENNPELADKTHKETNPSSNKLGVDNTALKNNYTKNDIDLHQTKTLVNIKEIKEIMDKYFAFEKDYVRCLTTKSTVQETLEAEKAFDQYACTLYTDKEFMDYAQKSEIRVFERIISTINHYKQKDIIENYSEMRRNYTHLASLKDHEQEAIRAKEALDQFSRELYKNNKAMDYAKKYEPDVFEKISALILHYFRKFFKKIY